MILKARACHFQIKQTLSKLQKDDGCRLAEVCSDWLGQTLCKAAFGRWRHSNYSYVSSDSAGGLSV